MLQHAADQTKRQNDKRDANKLEVRKIRQHHLRLLKSAAINVLDDRSRSIDLICLLILCDQFSNGPSVVGCFCWCPAKMDNDLLFIVFHS